MKWPIAPMAPMKHRAAHRPQDGRLVQTKGSDSEASSVPTQPV